MLLIIKNRASEVAQQVAMPASSHVGEGKNCFYKLSPNVLSCLCGCEDVPAHVLGERHEGSFSSVGEDSKSCS